MPSLCNRFQWPDNGLLATVSQAGCYLKQARASKPELAPPCSGSSVVCLEDDVTNNTDWPKNSSIPIRTSWKPARFGGFFSDFSMRSRKLGPIFAGMLNPSPPVLDSGSETQPALAQKPFDAPCTASPLATCNLWNQWDTCALSTLSSSFLCEKYKRGQPHDPIRSYDLGKDSVVDADLRSFDHRNLFLLGSGTFPTSATANPSLTIAALSLRSVDAIAASAK